MVDSIFLQPTVPTEVFILINNALVNKKACGPDNISPYFIKVAAATVSEPLSEFLNCSFTFGIFPDILKLAKVVPVFKSGNKRVLLTIVLFPFYIVSPRFLKICYISDWILLSANTP